MFRALLTLVAIVVLFASGLVAAESGTGRTLAPLVNLSPPGPAQIKQVGNYVMLGWNDLGMHCISPSFKEMCILPPYNNVWAVVIQKGDDPVVVTRGLRITYSLDGNTTVKNKTDFWTYAPGLFGPLPTGLGLTGRGLSGQMTPVVDHFEATGIPALPFLDNGRWVPFQQATLKLTGAGVSGTTSVVVPVSQEMNCAKCHAKGKVAAVGINTPTVEGNILTLHDGKNGTSLMASRPVLCANCHADPALGKVGTRGVKSLSLAMHGRHSMQNPQPACYDCHPGVTTQCNRSLATSMGPIGKDPQCDHCHGNLTKMAAGLAAGRQPWLQEPTCAQCHGVLYTTGATLYRKAKGHGGIYCAACHNSPHAWWPSLRPQDNSQPYALQRNNHAIGYYSCKVCHTDGRTGRMPPHWED